MQILNSHRKICSLKIKVSFGFVILENRIWWLKSQWKTRAVSLSQKSNCFSNWSSFLEPEFYLMSHSNCSDCFGVPTKKTQKNQVPSFLSHSMKKMSPLGQLIRAGLWIWLVVKVVSLTLIEVTPTSESDKPGKHSRWSICSRFDQHFTSSCFTIILVQ